MAGETADERATSAAIRPADVAHARDTWRRDAPRRFRELLDAVTVNDSHRGK